MVFGFDTILSTGTEQKKKKCKKISRNKYF